MNTNSSSQVNQSIKSGVFWSFLSVSLGKLVQFLVSIILCRLLAPDDFGIIALLTAFISLAGVFTNSGFCSSIIQKTEIDHVDCDSVFWLNLIISVTIAAILFLIAPYIGGFYGRLELGTALRWLSILIVISGVSLVQNALLIRQMAFKRQAIINLTALILSATVSIILAYCGAGVFTLVTQQLVSEMAIGLLLWATSQWYPRFRFSWSRLRNMFGFSSRIFAAEIINVAGDGVAPFLIGKRYSTTELSFYSRGLAYPLLLSNIVCSTIVKVMFPAFAKCQNNRKLLEDTMRSVMKATMFLTIPILAFSFAFAGDLIEIILTAKWLPCLIFFQIGCFIYLIYPLQALNVQILVGCGHGNSLLLLQLLKKIQLLLIIFITYRIGVVAIALGVMIDAWLALYYNTRANRNLISYGLLRQLMDCLPLFGCGVISAIGAYAGVAFVYIPYQRILFGIIIFIILYLACSYLFVRETFVKVLHTGLVYLRGFSFLRERNI